MATIFDVSFSDKKVIFINPKTEKAEGFNFTQHMETTAALRIVKREIEGRESVAAATVSLFVDLLDNPRLDGYKGQTPINETLPKELKQAIRDMETECFKGPFVAMLEGRGNTPAKAEDAYQKFASGLREGGSYAQAKGKITAYFAHCGMLPCVYVDGKPQKDKLFTVAAIEKLLANAKAASPREAEDNSIAAQIVAIAEKLDKRTETTVIGGDVYGLPSAIAALRQMLATFEGLEREEGETRTTLTHAATAVIAKASGKGKAKAKAEPATI